MKRFEIEVTLDREFKATSGVKGFLISKAWPFVKDLLIDLFIDLLSKPADDKKVIEGTIKGAKGAKGFIVRSVWPLVKQIFLKVLEKNRA